MPTEQIQKAVSGKLVVIRDILNSQYGVVGLLAALFYVIGQLSPAEYDQATHFVTHTVDELNNPVGVSVIIFFLLVYINRTFFQKYLEKQVQYAEAVRDFEAAIKTFAGQCSFNAQTRREEDTTIIEHLKLLNDTMNRFYNEFQAHEQYAATVSDRIEMDLTPNITRILAYIEGGGNEG